MTFAGVPLGHEFNSFVLAHEDLKGNWSVVVFYPADFSFVCPTELQDVQNHYAKLQELGV
ncbi:redoxin domain-containing protein, partial [Staphylococcus hyicus]|uniref:redoxin domain-containing protein n=1 Tax=Staphylococcus hyicus TaxID=1284 RepID=UPI000D4151FF